MTSAIARLAAAFLMAASVDWFAGTAPLSVRLEAPLNDLFAHAQQDGYAVRGSLAWSDGEGDVHRLDEVKFTVRGNTSRRETECSFPKLKAAWPGGSVKIGTHCGDSEGEAVTPKYGRLPNEMSPVREQFAYHLLDTLGVPTLRTRPARITYVYTDAEPGTPDAITRNAFLLEQEDAARRRMGAATSVSAERFTNARDAFAPGDTAAIAFAEALLGNFDWCLRFFKGDTYRCDGRHPLWNLLAFKWTDGTLRPVMYDFDVSGLVAGYHRWFGTIFNERFLPSRSHAAIEVTAQLQHARSLFDRDVLDATRRRFAAKKAAAYRALADAPFDADGKRSMAAYLDPFFEAMTSDDAFYRPVVVAPDTRAYIDADRSRQVCASVGPLPVGTAVGEPLQTRGDMMQVILLDTMWKYTAPVKCSYIHEKPVWISKSAVGTNYP